MLKKLSTLMFIALAIVNIVAAAEKYAVLVTGDYAGKDIPAEMLWQTGSTEKDTYGYDEFWNDTYIMWEMLIERGYQDENIYVLFADGQDFYLVNEGVAERYRPTNVGFESTITDNAATKANLEAVAGELNGKMTGDDFLFVWTFDHGTYTPPLSSWDSKLVLMDYYMPDDEFARLFNPIPAAKKVYWMQQCYSGGFWDDLTNNNQLTHVYFNSAASMTLAYRADDCLPNETYIPELENEKINRVTYHHGEFNFHIYSSTVGKTPNPVFTDNYNGVLFSDADLNGDGIISVEESAFWERTYESSTETPYIANPGNIGVHTSLKFPTLIHSDYHKYSSFIKGIMAVPQDLTIGTQDLVLPANSHTTLLDGKNITIANGYKLRVQSGAVLKINNGSRIKVEDGGQFLIEDGGKLLVEGSAVLAGNISAPANSVIEVAGSGELHIQEISNFDFLSGSVLKLNSNSKLYVENGTDLTFNSGSAVEVYEGSEVIVGTKAYMTANGTSFNYTGASGGKWFGINGLGGSSVSLDNVTITDAAIGVTGVYNYKFNVINSVFENCDNGIIVTELVPTASYNISGNTFTGTRAGTGVHVTSSNGIMKNNTISFFLYGARFTMCSPTVSNNTIFGNKIFGILVSGQNAIPQLINTDINQVSFPNNEIYNNGGTLNSPSELFLSAQIGIIPYANVYMYKGKNNIFSGIVNTTPLVPCISIAKLIASVNQNIIVKAAYNYWGSSSVNYDFFFEDHYQYSIEYTPYYVSPDGLVDPDEPNSQSSSTENQILTNAIRLESKENVTPAIKLYEHIIKKYVDTPEYYIAMARLPYLYALAELDNNELIAIYDEAYASENTTNKKFFKGMKVSTHIKGKRYDDAIAVAEEMKTEAEFDEEVTLADINIAIANLLKEMEGKSRSGVDYAANLHGLLSKLNSSEVTGSGEPSDITESVLPTEIKLYQNYPNPFNPVTQIRFALAKTADVKLSVYNINGQQVAQLANGSRHAGVHTVGFDGSRFNSGVYYYTLEVDGKSLTQKMILMK